MTMLSFFIKTFNPKMTDFDHFRQKFNTGDIHKLLGPALSSTTIKDLDRVFVRIH